MKEYKNLNNNSLVESYEINDKYIDIKYKDNLYVYRFSEKTLGYKKFQSMKEFAIQGYGLYTYIIGEKLIYDSYDFISTYRYISISRMYNDNI